MLGREVEEFEAQWARWCGAPFCVACNSGTDAIRLALAARGVAPGDRVIVPANTCVPTAAAVDALGAEIGLCDVLPGCGLMDPEALDWELTRRPARAVVPVHLYGQSADLEAIEEVAARHGAVVVQDGAQAHGARYSGKRVGAHGGEVAWSFYPSKNLGAFGDGGAVTTHSPEVAGRLRMLRNYGQERRYVHAVRGVNSRLDEVQAAILITRLPRLEVENERRRAIAACYRREIRNPAVRFVEGGRNSVGCEHLFPALVEGRERFQQDLRRAGIETLIHYPVPIHLQPAYAGLGHRAGDFPVAERLCAQVISLPLYPELTEDEVGRVIEAVGAWAG